MLLVTAGFGIAAEHGGDSHGSEDGGHANVDLWKTFNFTLLALGLGWLLKKFAGPYFRSRTKEIQQGIVEARRLKEEAEAKSAEMVERMSGLDAEITALRDSAKEEIGAEESRLKAETGQAAERMKANAEQEISSAAKQAKNDLRAYAAGLALELARQKARERMTPEVESGLIEAVIVDLERMK